MESNTGTYANNPNDLILLFIWGFWENQSSIPWCSLIIVMLIFLNTKQLILLLDVCTISSIVKNSTVRSVFCSVLIQLQAGSAPAYRDTLEKMPSWAQKVKQCTKCIIFWENHQAYKCHFTLNHLWRGFSRPLFTLGFGCFEVLFPMARKFFRNTL